MYIYISIYVEILNHICQVAIQYMRKSFLLACSKFQCQLTYASAWSASVPHSFLPPLSPTPQLLGAQSAGQPVFHPLGSLHMSCYSICSLWRVKKGKSKPLPLIVFKNSSEDVKSRTFVVWGGE